ncbi:MAG: MFS transporter [Alphaproteobacteria bacterium]|nr:MFS transporter [Alphaproteobacteria bacterium]MBQ6011582.1 MFS transporter [Alphaproteobacteria bacterium]
MAREKYISMRQNVTGFSFANLGLFTGFASSVVSAVYSLVLLEIFKLFFNEEMASSAVGIYAAIIAVFSMCVGLFSTQILRWFTKTRLLGIVLSFLGACYCMMSFSVKPGTFITLDFMAQFALTLLNILLPLFISDFSRGVGMEKLHARYLLWVNIGAFIAPMFAMSVVSFFNNNYRMPLLAAGLVYFSGLLFFKHFGIVQEDKIIKRVNMRKTLRALKITALHFFKKDGMLRAYTVNFGYYALRAMRYLYVPIVVIEKGFTSETLGIVLSVGILPYIIIESFIGKLIKKFGVKIWLTIGFVSFAIFSIFATFVSGYALLAIFVLWQISGAFMEACHDLLFFDDMPKEHQAKFYGIFRTSVNFPSVIAPILGGICIAVFNSTSAVWLITAVMGILSTIVLWSKH